MASPCVGDGCPWCWLAPDRLVECLVASMILLVMLAFGASLLVMIDDRRVELPALLGVTLVFAMLIWRQLAPAASPWAAEILGAGAAVGGITATLIIAAGLPSREPGDTGPGSLLPGPLLIQKLIGVALVIAGLAGAFLLGQTSAVGATILLLATGTAICLIADNPRRVAIGCVLLLFGMHLLYLAPGSRVGILETLLLDSLPSGVTLVIAAFGTVHTAPRPASRIWTAVLPDIEEPLYDEAEDHSRL